MFSCRPLSESNVGAPSSQQAVAAIAGHDNLRACKAVGLSTLSALVLTTEVLIVVDISHLLQSLIGRLLQQQAAFMVFLELKQCFSSIKDLAVCARALAHSLQLLIFDGCLQKWNCRFTHWAPACLVSQHLKAVLMRTHVNHRTPRKSACRNPSE